MATNTVTQPVFPSFDFEKEMQRWNRYMNLVNEAEPSVNPTPRQVVWKKNKATLWHYPAEEKKHEVPILIIYSLINQAFVLDIAKGSSLIEGLVTKGYDVYLLDWGIPGYEDKDLTLDDYVIDYIQKSVRRTMRHSGSQKINLLGYCFGGTLAAIYAALAEEHVENLILAAAPVDFSHSILPDKWDEGHKNGSFNIDRMIDVYGNVPADYLKGMFRFITTPISNSPQVALLTRAHDSKFVDKWRRMNMWTEGHIPFAGEAFRQTNRELLVENRLIKNEMTIRGKKVDLSNLKANLLVVNADKDSLVPKYQSEPLLDVVSSERKRFELANAGHISLATSGKLANLVDKWIKEESLD